MNNASGNLKGKMFVQKELYKEYIGIILNIKY